MTDTITPAGLPAATSASDAHIIPAMLAGIAEGLTVAQIAERARQVIVDNGNVALDTWVELVAQIEANQDGLAALVSALALKAPLESPALTGTPAAPTAAPGTSTTQVATTAFAADAAKINGLTAKTTPVDADEFRIADSEASFGFKKLTFANLKAWVRALIGAEVVTPWVAYTPTFTGFGAVTGASFRSRRVGGSLEIIGRFTTGTCTGTEARITLGFDGTNGGVSVASFMNSANWPAGGVVTAVAASTFFGVEALASGGNGYFKFGAQTSTANPTVAANGNSIAADGALFMARVSIPIEGW